MKLVKKYLYITYEFMQKIKKILYTYIMPLKIRYSMRRHIKMYFHFFVIMRVLCISEWCLIRGLIESTSFLSKFFKINFHLVFRKVE